MNVFAKIDVCEVIRHGLMPRVFRRLDLKEIGSEKFLGRLHTQMEEASLSASPSLRQLYPETMQYLRTALKLVGVRMPLREVKELLVTEFGNYQKLVLIMGLAGTPEYPLTYFDLRMAVFSLVVLVEVMLVLKEHFGTEGIFRTNDTADFTNALRAGLEKLRDASVESVDPDKQAVIGLVFQFFVAGNPHVPFLLAPTFRWETNHQVRVKPILVHGRGVEAHVLDCSSTHNLALFLSADLRDAGLGVEKIVAARAGCWTALVRKTSPTCADIRLISASGRESQRVSSAPLSIRSSSGCMDLILVQENYCVSVFCHEVFVARLSLVDFVDRGFPFAARFVGFGGRIELPDMPDHTYHDEYRKATSIGRPATPSIPIILRHVDVLNIWGLRHVLPILFCKKAAH